MDERERITEELIKQLVKMGYPAEFGAAIANNLRTEKTMSRMIREYFTNLVAPRKVVRSDRPCRFLELAESAGVRLPKGWRFNRAECHERGSAK